MVLHYLSGFLGDTAVSDGLKRRTASEVKKTKEKRFSCDDCGAVFKYPTSYKRHKTLHNLQAATFFKCSECEYSTTRKDHLKAHMARHIID